MNGGVHREEALGRRGRLEALHLSFAAQDRLVGDLGPIVLPQTLLVARRKPNPDKAAPYDGSLSVVIFVGAKPCFLSSLRMSLPAAALGAPLGGSPSSRTS